MTDAATLPEDGAADDGALLAAKEAEEFPIVLVAGVYLVLLWPVVRLISRHGRKIAS